jgi:large conductance mechanosensitive channel
MKKFFSDFKKFIFERGNIVDLAVAVIIGAAFGKIVTSLVNDIVMPLVTLLVGGKSVEELKWVITPAEIENGVVTVAENALRYGLFLQAVIDFLIIALFIFLALRLVMKLKDGFRQFERELKKASHGETKKLKRELKAQGLDGRAIRAEFDRREREAAARAKAEAEAKKAQEEAERPPTTDELLTEIRDLLKEKTKEKP